MRVIHGSSSYPETAPPLALGIGNFDGVHRGHRALLERLHLLAARRAVPAAVLTFRPHPAQLLRPEQAPPLLCDPEDERALLAEAGVQLLIEEPFVPELARLSPEQFVKQVLLGRLHACRLVVGFSFHFGARAAGTAETLQQLGAGLGIEVEIVPAITQQGVAISSSRIRAAVGEGRLEEATELLGHPFRLSGTVVHGEGRGRQLGFPTINLARSTPLLPRHGVYAARALLHRDDRVVAAAVSIGVRPTFGEKPLAIEAHLVEFEGDLYGQRVSLDLLRFLRPERRFAGVEELTAALREDLALTRQLLGAASEAPATGALQLALRRAGR
ncbi:MAG: bifunctional riboflavin kinase/FAD synthetase [Deltaproteobacteria bacterium]|nr:bifunctional riboflavin kinase/FAD synthetase [Deltaproteobacteria bacterium]